jgi:hypothetical protein
LFLLLYDIVMLITDRKEAKKLAAARAQPLLWFTPFSALERLKEIWSRYFQDLTHQVDLYSVNRGSLACICHSDSSATIYIHQILNHSETPIEVI